MSERADLLTRYFRTVADIGGREIVLDRFTPESARARVLAALATTPPASTWLSAVTVDAVLPSLTVDGTAAGKTLSVLATDAAGCTRCRLHETRRTVVFGEGNSGARVVVVGEAPGAAEDRSGRPFVGKAGQLLDLLLLSAGFPRDCVYICNLLKCRPPGNRDPQADEVATCTRHYLEHQIAAIAPRAILAVGRFPAQFLLGSDAPIGRLRGRVGEWQGIPVIPTYHPAYLLRSPQGTRTAWRDVQLLWKVLSE